MSNDFREVIRTCAVFNRERGPEEPRFELPRDQVVAYLYDLIRALHWIGDGALDEIEYALGCDGPDLELHQRAIAIRQSLEALRSAARAVFYLLPGTDDARLQEHADEEVSDE